MSGHGLKDFEYDIICQLRSVGPPYQLTLTLLAQAARAHAFLRERAYVVPEDVRALAPDVLRHRIVLTFEAEAEDVTTDDVVARVLGAVRVP
jgi:MoxR-like ATPase